MKVDRAMAVEHEVIVYCKEHQEIKVITAMDIDFKKYRQENGIEMK